MYLIFAIVCAFVCYQIAKNNLEWNEWIGAAVGFFGGIIGVLIYVGAVVYKYYIKKQ